VRIKNSVKRKKKKIFAFFSYTEKKEDKKVCIKKKEKKICVCRKRERNNAKEKQEK